MYQIEHFPEVWADACLRDSEGRFLFLSLYGRDTALLQLMAAMELPRGENGLDRFVLIERCADRPSQRRHLVDVAGTARLSKLTARLPKDSVFGPLLHTWLYDTTVAEPDLVNRQGWAVRIAPQASDRITSSGLNASKSTLDDNVWTLLQRLSPVPLLDAWRVTLMQLAGDTGMVRRLDDPADSALGDVQGARVSLGELFLPMLSDLAARGVITLPNDRVGP